MIRKQRSGIWKIYSEDEACKLIEGWYKLQQNTQLIKQSNWWSINTRDRGIQNRFSCQNHGKRTDEILHYLVWTWWVVDRRSSTSVRHVCLLYANWIMGSSKDPGTGLAEKLRGYLWKHNYFLTSPSIWFWTTVYNFFEESKGEGQSESYGYGSCRALVLNVLFMWQVNMISPLGGFRPLYYPVMR